MLEPVGTVVDGVDVDALDAAVRACPAVASLAGDRRATYLPGRRVSGIAIDRDAVVIEVTARWGTALADLVHQVRSAAAPFADGRRIDLLLADIEDAPEAAVVP